MHAEYDASCSYHELSLFVIIDSVVDSKNRLCVLHCFEVFPLRLWRNGSASDSSSVCRHVRFFRSASYTAARCTADPLPDLRIFEFLSQLFRGGISANVSIWTQSNNEYLWGLPRSKPTELLKTQFWSLQYPEANRHQL